MSQADEPLWISKTQALYIHEQSLKRHGGGQGIRDASLLESALARAENAYAYGERDIHSLAALYAKGIARNHPFVDGNKRTAYTVSGLFLALNGFKLAIADTAKQIKLFEDVAAGIITKERLADFYRQNTTAITDQ